MFIHSNMTCQSHLNLYHIWAPIRMHVFETCPTSYPDLYVQSSWIILLSVNIEADLSTPLDPNCPPVPILNQWQCQQAWNTATLFPLQRGLRKVHCHDKIAAFKVHVTKSAVMSFQYHVVLKGVAAGRRSNTSVFRGHEGQSWRDLGHVTPVGVYIARSVPFFLHSLISSPPPPSPAPPPGDVLASTQSPPDRCLEKLFKPIVQMVRSSMYTG